jgi:MULE transposase domain
MDCTYNTNKFNMPLFTITGVTFMSYSFTVGMAFLDGETFDEFQWILRQIQQLYQDIHFQAPCIIVTDCDSAFMKRVKDVFPTSQNLLCIWHIFKNITIHCRPAFLTREVEKQ